MERRYRILHMDSDYDGNLEKGQVCGEDDADVLCVKEASCGDYDSCIECLVTNRYIEEVHDGEED